MERYEKNWFFAKYKEQLVIVSTDYNDFQKKLLEKGYLINLDSRIRRVIDWDTLDEKHVFYYDFEGNELEIYSRFKESPIYNEMYLIVECGPEYPIMRVSVDFFMEHWYEFVMLNGYMGCCALSGSDKYILEFTDATDYLLYSNFLL